MCAEQPGKQVHSGDLLKALCTSATRRVTAAGYAEEYDVATSTAYSDLHKLVALGYLVMEGEGGRMEFMLRRRK